MSVLWFLLLWSITALRILCEPLARIVRLFFLASCVVVGVYLCVVGISYQYAYQTHVRRQAEFEKKKIVLLEREQQLRLRYTAHPTAVGILRELSSIACVLGKPDCQELIRQQKIYDL